VEQEFVYDPLSRVTSLPIRGAGLLEQFDYTHDLTGRRTSVTQLSVRQASYTYDSIYRLTREEVTGDPANNGAVDYSYDPVGNRTDLTSTLAPIASATYSYNLNDRLIADTYDNNGNTLASGGDTFAYDFEDRLTNFDNGQVVNVYDGDGNRVARSEAGGTTLYLIDDRNPVGPVDKGLPITSFSPFQRASVRVGF